MCLKITFYICFKVLALNDIQWLICHTTQPNHTHTHICMREREFDIKLPTMGDMS